MRADVSPQPKQTTLCTCLHEQVTYVFVESCDARTLLGTVTRLFIPASEHSVLKPDLVKIFVFVPGIILFKSNMDAISIIMFYCSIPFQRYQTWYVNNYLNLISSHASPWEGVVLVMLHRAMSRDVARCHRPITGLDHCRPIRGLEKCQDRQETTDRQTTESVTWRKPSVLRTAALKINVSATTDQIFHKF